VVVFVGWIDLVQPKPLSGLDNELIAIVHVRLQFRSYAVISLPDLALEEYEPLLIGRHRLIGWRRHRMGLIFGSYWTLVKATGNFLWRVERL
jgi:hypothetical protein